MVFANIEAVGVYFVRSDGLNRSSWAIIRPLILQEMRAKTAILRAMVAVASLGNVPKCNINIKRARGFGALCLILCLKC